MVGVCPVTEGVDGSDRISGNVKEIYDEISTGSFTNLVYLGKLLVLSHMEDFVMRWGG